MTLTSFVSLYDKLERLVQRLPESLQGPILREITPIKTLFLLQRPPRLVLLGQRTAGKAALLNALFAGEALRADEELLHDGVWQSIARQGRGTLRLLDARRPVSTAAAQQAMMSEPGDLYVFLRSAMDIDEALPSDLAHAAQVIEAADRRHETRPKVLALQLSGGAADIENAREQLHAAMHTEPRLESRMIGTLAFTGAEGQIDRFAEIVAKELPDEARLELARISGNRVLQREVAQVVTKSITAICAAIGTQPIPLADFPILTSLQATMVAGIMHISGREMSPRLAGEFIAALGANVGVGLVLREGARAAAKFVPFWGNAISGAVAGAGTYAVGRSAMAYFIDGVSLRDARAFFKREKSPPLLKD